MSVVALGRSCSSGCEVRFARDAVDSSSDGKVTMGGRFGAASAGEDGRRLLALEAARGEADVMLVAEGTGRPTGVECDCE